MPFKVSTPRHNLSLVEIPVRIRVAKWVMPVALVLMAIGVRKRIIDSVVLRGCRVESFG